ncbi:MAG TPA: QueT transporter family protein [Pseudogracilibacillus sp.]|nr:QueT transporter family protein [Pseudogracilibacillus sp.]
MNTRNLVMNALVAALYVVVTLVVAPFGFSAIQFRLSEIFNHLIVFNKKYFFGIAIGVFLANLMLSPMKADLIFGVGHTVVSLLIVMAIGIVVKNKLTLMLINAFVFSFNMFIIAYMLKFFGGLENEAFLPLWGMLGIEELVTMLITIPIILLIARSINFEK